MSQIQKVAFSLYPVKDMARAREFYEEILGLEAGESFEGKWQEYDIGGTCFAISNSILDFVKPGTQQAVAFEVQDIKSFVEELKSKGVTFKMDDIMDTPVCHMAFIQDPDGNGISIHQLK
jgi:catechol 2,3-dioxygenase-like lactoylglutathione lyase family enzyme